MPRVRTVAAVVVIGVALLLFSGLGGSGSKDNSNSGANSEKTLNALVKEIPQEPQDVPVAAPKIRKITIEYVESEQKHFIIFDNGEKTQFQNKNDLNGILAESLSKFAEKVEFVSYSEDEYRDVVEAFLRTYNKR